MLKVILHPVHAITDAVMEHHVWKTVFITVGVSVCVGLGVFFVFQNMQVAAITFGVVFASVLVLASCFDVVMRVLSGGGGFYQSLTAVAFGLASPAVFSLVSAIAYLAVNSIVLDRDLAFVISLGIGAVLMAASLLQGAATFFAAMRDLFETDALTVLVGVAIVVVFLTALGGGVWWVLTAPPLR